MATRSDLDVYVNGHDNLTRSLNRMQSNVIRTVGAISASLAALELTTMPVRAIREFEREMANVQKTTGFTDFEIRQLGKSLRDMSTRVDIAATDLAKIAAAGGQQGLGREGVAGIEQFTDSVSRMSSVLDISVEEAGTAIGKLASIFNVPLQDIEQMVSALNEVANNSTAAGDQLIDVVRRVGDAAGAFRSYADTIGIGASAIDFGVSPEVAGTSITKIFADMQSKAAKFSDFMKMSTEEWINLVQSDGINAFKMYLDRLRDLNGESRQATIRELSGTGRIGALMNKFVNDTTNSILDRNLDSAYRGLKSGTSAIREQETVIRTLDAQINITQNAFRNLGIVAGEQFAQPLAGYMAQITEALRDPAVQSFAEALGRSFLDLVDRVASLASAVASLNVNWENFVGLAATLLQIKFATWAAGLIARMTGLNKVLQSSTDAMSAANAAAAGGTASAGSRVAGAVIGKDQIAELRALAEERRKVAQAIAEQQLAERRLQAAEQAHTEALQRQSTAYAARRAAQETVSGSAAQVQAAATAARAAQEQVAKVTETAQATLNARRQKAEAEHLSRMAAIEKEYQRQRLLGQQSGDKNLQRQVEEANAYFRAQEEQRHARSLRSIDAYYKRREAMERAAAQKEAALAAANAANARAAMDATISSSGVNSRNLAYTAALNEASRTSRELRNAREAADVAAVGAQNAAKSYSVLANSARVARVALSALATVASKALIWGTILYSVADMLGIVDKLGPAFQRLTDKLGLTSEAQRELAQEVKNANDRMREQEQQIEDNIAKYQQSLDPLTGRLNETQVDALPTLISGENTDAARKAIEELLTLWRGASDKIQRDGQRLELIPNQTQEVDAQLAAARQKYEDYYARLERLSSNFTEQERRQLESIRQGSSASLIPNVLVRQYAAIEKEMRNLEGVMTDLQARSSLVGEELRESLERGASEGQISLEKLRPIVAGLFTPETADVFQEYAPRVAELREELVELNSQLKDNRQEQIAAGAEGGEALAAVQRRGEELQARLGEITQEQRELGEAAMTTINQLSSAPGVSDTLLRSAAALKSFLTMSPEDIRNLLEAVRTVTDPSLFTGANAPITPRGANEGADESYTPRGSGEAAARRLARARLDLAKAQAESEARIAEDANKAQLESLQDLYDEGLVAIEDFYRRKEAMQREDLDRSIALARREREAVQTEMSGARDEATRLTAQANLARVDSEIAILEARRGRLAEQIIREQRDALREFQDVLQSQNLSVMQALGGSSDTDLFRQALVGYEIQYRDFMNRLRTEAVSNPALQAMVDQMQEMFRLQATDTVFSQISEETNLADGATARLASRMELLRRAGVITTGDLAAGMDKVRESQAAIAEEGIRRMTEQLAGLDKETLAYRNLAAQIDEARLRLETLRTEANLVAQEINDGFQNALTDAFQNFRIGDDVADTLLGVLTGWLGTLQNVLGQSIAESIMSGINGGIGGDGIGGMFASLFGMTGDSLTDKGSSPLNPLFVQEVGAGGMIGGGLDLLGGLGGSLADELTPIGDAVKFGGEEAAGTLASTFTSFLTGAENTFTSLWDGLGSILSGLFSGGGGGVLPGLLSLVAHSGAVVGHGGGTRRMVHPGMFAGAERMHSGRIGVGLAPDEVPAILRRGEEVLTEDDPRNALNGGLNRGGVGRTDVNLRVVPVLDPEVMTDAMASSAGEKVVMVHIQKNASRIKRIIS